MAILFLGKQARPLLGLRLCLGGDDLELLELGHGPVALGLEGDLRLAHALGLAQQLTGLLELGRQAVTFLDDTAQLGRRALPRLGERCLEPLDLGAKLVALLGGGTDDREPLERVAELLLEPLALGVELAPLGAVQFPLLGETALVLCRRSLRLGECRLQAVELLARARVLVAEPAELLLVRGARLGEDALEPVDVAQQPLAFGRGGSLRLGQRGLELLDLGAQPVPLLGGGVGGGEPLECVTELLLDPVALRGELVAHAGVALLDLGEPAVLLAGRGLRLGEGGMEPLELGRDLVALLLQPRELLLALVPSLGEDGLQALDLGRRALVLLLQVVRFCSCVVCASASAASSRSMSAGSRSCSAAED